jgi:hypothetical protein
MSWVCSVADLGTLRSCWEGVQFLVSGWSRSPSILLLFGLVDLRFSYLSDLVLPASWVCWECIFGVFTSLGFSCVGSSPAHFEEHFELVFLLFLYGISAIYFSHSDLSTHVLDAPIECNLVLYK